MTKPLELIVYPPLEYPHQADPITMGRYIRQRNGELIMRNIKRFTDAELAAEYWAAAEEATSTHFRMHPNAIEAQRIEGTLYRFATLPHYDEPTP